MKADLKEDIISAARELFYTNGYYNTSLRNVADKVSIHHSNILYYFPNKKAAIEYTPLLKDGWKDWRYENAKNWLCLKSGITFVRILAPKMKPFSNCKYVKLRSWSAQEMNNATRQAFKKLKIQVDVNVERDLLIIAEGNHEENQEIIS